MTSTKNWIAAVLLLFSLRTLAQQPLTGRVLGATERDGEPLPGASVKWLGTTIIVLTDNEGGFTIEQPPVWPASLAVSFVGYRADTLLLRGMPGSPLRIELSWAGEMAPVEVVERVEGTRLDTRTMNATEVIGSKELKRAACCDLSESFETNATVDVNYSDAVSGTKTIRMLGLDGKYAQMSMENIPFIRGLSTASGLTLIPGTWIQDINLSKGAGTAVNGPNAMTGQIDLCLLNPLNEGPLFVNVYGNSQGRAEVNVHAAQRTGANSANLLLVHGNRFNMEMDQNNDGFMDQPRTRRINVLDRWMYLGERKSGQATLRVVNDERWGGRTTGHAMAGTHQHGDLPTYGIGITDRMVDAFGKHGWVFENDATKSIGLIGAVRWHGSNSRYGIRTYDGLQQSAYASMVYQQLLGTGTDQVKAGVSFQYDDYEERFTVEGDTTLDLGRTERMPGLFVEHTLKRADFTVVSGVRVDRNDLYGTVASPRIHAKYDFGPLTTARVSIGRGFRTANPLVEHAAVMASSRRVSVDPLGMERAWNFGASFLHKFKWLDRKWALGLDAYHTLFTDQVVADLDRSPQALAFYMLNGSSYANSALLDLQVELHRTLRFKASYRYYDVRTTYDGRLLARPFTPAHRGLLDLSYADMKERWRFDITWSLFGASRIPGTATNPEGLRLPPEAPAYTTLHAQVTRLIGAWEFYLGAENITSTLQQQQIIGADDPYGPYFDASLIWGPTNTAMLYAGLRYTLPRKNRTNQRP